MTLRLTKRAIRVLTARYRAVLLAAIMGTFFAGNAMAEKQTFADGALIGTTSNGTDMVGSTVTVKSSSAGEAKVTVGTSSGSQVELSNVSGGQVIVGSITKSSNNYASLSGSNHGTLQLGNSSDSNSVVITGDSKGSINVGKNSVVIGGGDTSINVGSGKYTVDKSGNVVATSVKVGGSDVVTESSLGTAINDAIDALDLPNTYEAKGAAATLIGIGDGSIAKILSGSDTATLSEAVAGVADTQANAAITSALTGTGAIKTALDGKENAGAAAAVETKLTAGAAGYDINANSLQVQGKAVLTTESTVDASKITTTGYTGSALEAAVVGTKVNAATSADSAKAVTSDAIDDSTIKLDGGKLKVGTIGFGNIDTANIIDGANASTKLTTQSYVDEALATKQDALVEGNAGDGIVITPASGSNPAKIAVNNGTSLKFDSGKLDVNIASGSALNNSGSGLTIKTGAGISQDATNGLYIGSEAITGDMIKNGTITKADLSSDLYTAAYTYKSGSDSVLATTAAIDNAFSQAITYNSTDKTVRLVANNTSDVYTTEGTQKYVEDNAEKGTYTGAQVNGGTGTVTLKGALEATNTQVDANTDDLTTLKGDVNTSGSVLHSIKGNAENATYTALTSGTRDLTSNSTLAGALQTLDSSKASLNLANTFTKDNTFQGKVIVGTGTDLVTLDGGNVSAAGKVTALTLAAGTGGNKFEVDADGALKVSNGNFNVDKDGNTTAKGTLDVTGATTLKSTLGVTGLTTLSSTNGLTFDGTTIVKAIAAADTSAFNTTTDGTTLATLQNINVLAEKATFTADATKYNVADGTLNSAITSLDQTIGNMPALKAAVADTASDVFKRGNLTNGSTTALTDLTVADALSNIDKTMGQIHGLRAKLEGGSGTTTTSAGSNLASGTTVEDHLTSLDAAIGNRTGIGSANDAINTATTTSVAAGLKAVGNAIGDQKYTSTRFVNTDDDLTTAISSLDSNLDKVENRVTNLEDRTQKMNREMKAGFASVAAMSALVPNARSAGDTQVSLGTGYYRGTAGFALGAFHHFNDNVMMNVGAGYSAHGAGTFRAGVTFGF